MPPPERQDQETQLADAISVELARIHVDSYGQEPKTIKTFILDDAIVSEVEVELLPHEQTILDNGGDPAGIRRVRGQYQAAIRPNFVAAVERTTGREVIGFTSHTHLLPTFSVEYFKLAPQD